jgi:hypothetical protein
MHSGAMSYRVYPAFNIHDCQGFITRLYCLDTSECPTPCFLVPKSVQLKRAVEVSNYKLCIFSSWLGCCSTSAAQQVRSCLRNSKIQLLMCFSTCCTMISSACDIPMGLTNPAMHQPLLLSYWQNLGDSHRVSVNLSTRISFTSGIPSTKCPYQGSHADSGMLVPNLTARIAQYARSLLAETSDHREMHMRTNALLLVDVPNSFLGNTWRKKLG